MGEEVVVVIDNEMSFSSSHAVSHLSQDRMSRATDAFSSLISEVPGVDTSCFVKRTLNDLRTSDSVKSPSSHEPSPAVQESPSRPPPPAQVSYASFDLDALGKPTTPKNEAQNEALLEDLFEHIPGCEETALRPTEAPQPPVSVTYPMPEPEPQPEPESEPFTLVEECESEDGNEGEAPLPQELLVEEPPRLEPEVEDESPSAPPMYFTAEPVAAKSSDFKQRFEKYKTKFNKKAVDFKKKGLHAVKQGFGVAQDWVDRYVEDRKQSHLTASQKKENARQIEQFLAEMEQLSHYRREQLMAEIPAEFFQRVIDYASLKGLAVEHLFITSEAENQPLQEPEPFPEDESATDAPGGVSERGEYVDVTGDDSQEAGYLEVTGDDSLGQPEAEEEEDFDLLGLSTDTRGIQPLPEETPAPLASPDDLDAFFTGGAPVRAAEASPAVPSFVFPANEDLMEFEGGSTSQVKSDFSEMYNQLKQSGQYSEEQIRAILKEQKLQAQQTKMAAALQAKVEREREVEEAQALHHELKQLHLQKIVAWKEKHAQNMRGLLTTLETVLWENSGWKPLTVGDVLEVSQVKKAYMKANLIIHPDKVKQKGGTAEQVVLADMVFNVLKEGWQKFQG